MEIKKYNIPLLPLLFANTATNMLNTNHNKIFPYFFPFDYILNKSLFYNNIIFKLNGLRNCFKFANHNPL